MKLDESQMNRQIRYETVLHWLSLLHENGVLSEAEYRAEKKRTESETDAPIKHISLYNKKNKSN